MERQALLSTVHVAPVGQDVDGFEAYVINVRAAFHRLRLRWNRNLAFLCLFDVLFSFITWALVSQGFHGDFKQNYIAHSVVDFHFSQSLFDVICVSAFRALLLAVAYYMLRSRSSVYMTFAVTASTCFLLVKIFYYGFTDSSQHPSDYMVIFVAFIMPWLECYIWLSRIAPLNRKISLLYGETTGGVVQPSDIEQMLIEERQMTNQFQVPTQLRYGATGLTPQTRPVDALAVGTSAKPINPPQYDAYTTHRVDINEGLGDSDVEDATLAQHRQRSRDNSSDHSPFSTPPSEPSEYIETRSQASSSQITVPMRAMGQMAPNDVFFATLAQSALNFVSEHARLEDSLWRVKEADKNGVVVHSIVKAEGPVYRSQGLIFSSPEQVFRVLYDQFERVPDWSRTFTACKVLRRIEKHTDMIYWATSDAVKQIGKRDLTEVRQWMHHDDAFTLGFASIKVPTVPPKSNMVRAVDRSSGFYLQRVRGTRMTKLTWIVNVDFKANSWLSGSSTKSSVPKMMVDFTEELRAAFDKQSQQHIEAAETSRGKAGREFA